MSKQRTLSERATEAARTLRHEGIIHSEWLPGMSGDGVCLLPSPGNSPCRGPFPVLSVSAGGPLAYCSFHGEGLTRLDQYHLEDPLTVRGLLLLVREAFGNPDLYTAQGTDGRWYLTASIGGELRSEMNHQGFDSELEVLVAGLEWFAVEQTD